MDIRDILSKVDHTVLSQTATWDDIRALCDDGMRYGTASVCIPAWYVRRAADYCAGRLPICTVIGFPNGYSTTQTKAFETRDAVGNGADEIDMVIAVGALKAGDTDAVRRDIDAVREACAGKVLKVIIETCLLTDEEKAAMCRVVADAGADYIKTSTGFNIGGATAHDVALLVRESKGRIRVKAAGGIKTYEDMEEFLSLGADRLGSSSAVRLVRERLG